MSITNRSSFFYGHTVDDTNNYFSFKESGSELNGELIVGDYTLESYATLIANAMTTAGTQTYSTSVDREVRAITISADSNFSLLVSSGTNTAAYNLIGFTSSDRTGSNSYTGDSSSGEVYNPQFLLQKYVASEDYSESIDPSINESGSGDIQVISFGKRKFMQCNITYITDREQGFNSPIENNTTGVSDLRDFLSNLINKSKIEFMENRDIPNVFEDMLLESTPESSTGTSFKLKELYNRGLPGFFETGLLKFRKI